MDGGQITACIVSRLQVNSSYLITFSALMIESLDVTLAQVRLKLAEEDKKLVEEG